MVKVQQTIVNIIKHGKHDNIPHDKSSPYAGHAM